MRGGIKNQLPYSRAIETKGDLIQSEMLVRNSVFVLERLSFQFFISPLVGDLEILQRRDQVFKSIHHNAAACSERELSGIVPRCDFQFAQAE
jgi:hypothetical protein